MRPLVWCLFLLGCTESVVLDPYLVDCRDGVEGSACRDGVCRGGACCAGCWDRTQCLPGAEVTACGTGGALCSICEVPRSSCAGRCRAEFPIDGPAQIGQGVEHACAVAGGVLWCWGRSDVGQLGFEPGAGGFTIVPTAVGSMAWREVASGQQHSCGLRQDGQLLCWGRNDSGQMGTGDPAVVGVRQLEPTVVLAAEVTEWKAVAVGGPHSCAIAVDGGLFCWGATSNYALGMIDEQVFTPQRLDLPAAVAQASMASEHACALLDNASGSLFCWGRNKQGQVGIGASGEPVQTPRAVGNGYRAVAVGDLHTCALRLDGAIRCWGDDSRGQLGNDADGGSEVPVDIVNSVEGATVGPWSAVASGDNHSCALAANDGSIWCWGDNARQQLGRGSGPASQTPVPTDSPGPWLMLVAHYNQTCAVAADGVLLCWGANGYGQLADNLTANGQGPTEIVFAD